MEWIRKKTNKDGITVKIVFINISKKYTKENASKLKYAKLWIRHMMPMYEINHVNPIFARVGLVPLAYPSYGSSILKTRSLMYPVITNAAACTPGEL